MNPVLDGPDFGRLAAPERLAKLRRAVNGRMVLTSSFGIEDQVLTHMVYSQDLDIEVVTLDTGRLFPETLDAWARTEARYGKRIRAFYPDSAAVETLLAQDGVDGFRRAVEARKACCHIRKVVPLRRALAGASVWIAGLRAEQSPDRANASLIEDDGNFGLIKVNPLIDWDRATLDAYAARHDVPLNALHARGFPSIGCAPCTRAVPPGAAERSGRWWWENEGGKECGLHPGPDGRLRRAAPATEARA